jgi:hypothetical protein
MPSSLFAPANKRGTASSRPDHTGLASNPALVEEANPAA